MIPEMGRLRFIQTALLLLVGASVAAAHEGGKPHADEPHVLLIGDSISIGYTPAVTRILADEAVVLHHKGNAQHTGTGLQKLDQWIGDTKWDVIHFNWGLWDLCYRNPDSKAQGKRDKEKGTLTTTPEQYGKNLEELVKRLKKTKAKLIWAHTTVVPPGEVGRIEGDAAKYNAIASEIMKRHGIPINDLHTLSAGFPPELFVKPGDVHFTKAGSEKLAEQVADSVRAALKTG